MFLDLKHTLNTQQIERTLKRFVQCCNNNEMKWTHERDLFLNKFESTCIYISESESKRDDREWINLVVCCVVMNRIVCFLCLIVLCWGNIRPFVISLSFSHLHLSPLLLQRSVCFVSLFACGQLVSCDVS
jgi:hypothetical protein